MNRLPVFRSASDGRNSRRGQRAHCRERGDHRQGPAIASWSGLEAAIGTAIRAQLLTGVPAILEMYITVMQAKMEKMWAEKLGLHTFNTGLFREFETLMAQTTVDYTIFFRELSTMPGDIGPLKKASTKTLRITQISKGWTSAGQSGSQHRSPSTPAPPTQILLGLALKMSSLGR